MVSFQVFIIILYREDVEWPLIMMMVITALLLMKMDVLLNGQQGGTQARVKGLYAGAVGFAFCKDICADNSVWGMSESLPFFC